MAILPGPGKRASVLIFCHRRRSHRIKRNEALSYSSARYVVSCRKRFPAERKIALRRLGLICRRPCSPCRRAPRSNRSVHFDGRSLIERKACSVEICPCRPTALRGSRRTSGGQPKDNAPSICAFDVFWIYQLPAIRAQTTLLTLTDGHPCRPSPRLPARRICQAEHDGDPRPIPAGSGLYQPALSSRDRVTLCARENFLGRRGDEIPVSCPERPPTHPKTFA